MPAVLLRSHPLHVALFLLLAASVMTLLLSTQGLAKPVQPSVEPWPPFTLVYEHATEHNGLSNPTVIELKYTDRRHWQATVLDDPSAPSRKGTRWLFDGNTMTYNDTHYGFTRTSRYGPDQQPLMDEWLGPGRLELIEQKPNAKPVQRVSSDLALLIREEVTKHPDTGKMVQQRQEITFRSQERIPVKMLSYRDGTLVERWEARALRVENP